MQLGHYIEALKTFMGNKEVRDSILADYKRLYPDKPFDGKHLAEYTTERLSQMAQEEYNNGTVRD